MLCWHGNPGTQHTCHCCSSSPPRRQWGSGESEAKWCPERKAKETYRRLAEDSRQPPFKKTSKSRQWGEGLSNAPNTGHTSWRQHGSDTESWEPWKFKKVHLGPPTHLPKHKSTHYFWTVIFNSTVVGTRKLGIKPSIAWERFFEIICR